MIRSGFVPLNSNSISWAAELKSFAGELPVPHTKFAKVEFVLGIFYQMEIYV